MTRPHDRWTSREIAQHTREQLARDAMGRYADIRSGKMYRGDDRRTAPGSAVMLAIALVAFAIAGTVASLVAGSPAPDMPHGPGWELCGKEYRRC
jgi:hypothetical protein